MSCSFVAGDAFLICMTAGLIAWAAWEGLAGPLWRIRLLALALVATAAFGALAAVSCA